MRQANSRPPKLKAFTAQAYDSDLAQLDKALAKYWGLRSKIFSILVRDLAKSLSEHPDATIQTFLQEFSKGNNSTASVINLHLTPNTRRKDKAR